MTSSVEKFLREVIRDSKVIRRSSPIKRAEKRNTRFRSYRIKERNDRRELELARLREERRQEMLGLAPQGVHPSSEG